MEQIRFNRFLSIIYIILLAGFFWIGSRVPQLNEKAMMGDFNNLSGIAFEPLIDYEPETPLWKKTVFNSINWLDTNRKGMTFGILFAAAFLVLLGSLKTVNFKNRFLNALMGTIAGAPLGVCVNCAAPIGYGVKAGGARTESAVSMMISSPSLNFIVLTMLFAFFPIYIIVIKIFFTLLLLLLVVPLLSKYFGTEAKSADIADVTAKVSEKMLLPFLSNLSSEQSEAWYKLLWEWILLNLKSLWFIVKKTVPLMILAGVLGSVLVTVLPFEQIQELLDVKHTFLMRYAILLIIVAFATFLPVPIAFDIILALILLSTGVPALYVMALLFCLGTYSIYAHFIVHKMVGNKMAISLFIVVMLIGAVAGYVAHKTEKWYNHRQLLIQSAYLSKFPFEGPKIIAEYQPAPIKEDSSGRVIFEAIPAEMQRLDAYPGLQMAKVPFQQKIPPTGKANSTLFTHHYPIDYGIDEALYYTEEHLETFFMFGGSIASGDANRDQWSDLLFTASGKLALYNNYKGKRFIAQALPDKVRNMQWIVNAAFADLNDDGWPDIVFSAYMDGNYCLYNVNGSFESGQLERLPNNEKAFLSITMSFGDLDRNGKLDIHFGNWSIGRRSRDLRKKHYWALGAAESKNSLLMRKEDWEVSTPEPYIGESLSALITDFNNDNRPDLICTNDFVIPDYFFLGTDEGNLKLVEKSNNLFPYSTRTTMSVSTADIDNDLIPEVYLTQVTVASPKFSINGLDDNSVEYKNPQTTNYIKKVHDSELGLRKKRLALNRVVGDPAEVLKNGREMEAIFALQLFHSLKHTGTDSNKVYFSEKNWAALYRVSNALHKAEPYLEKEALANAIPQRVKRNMLFKMNETGQFEDIGIETGIQHTSWSWTGKFMDLDLDGYQDLFVSNGFTFNLTNRLDNALTANNLFLNNGGKNFSDITKNSGMLYYWPVLAYTYIDIDLDGDMDIITLPTHLLPEIYINNAQGKNAIAFELNDLAGNYYGINSKVFIYYGNGRQQMREIQSGGGFKSFDAPLAHFGLDNYTAIDSCKILWSTGETTHLREAFEAGAKYIITRQAKENSNPLSDISE